MQYTMRAGTLLVLAAVIAVGQAPLHKEISGCVNHPIELATDFTSILPEITWKHTNPNNGKERQIAKIRNGTEVSRLDGYSQKSNGRVLVIDRLTKNNTGLYIAEVTLPNGTVVTRTFNVTADDPVPPVTDPDPPVTDPDPPVTDPDPPVKMKQRIHIWIIPVISVLFVAAVFGPILYITCKSSSATRGRGDQNVTFRSPVQDTETQVSLFIDIPHEKIGMKTKEADEEMVLKIEEEPNFEDK